MATRGILKGLDRDAQQAFRLRVVREALEPDTTVAAAARRNGVSSVSVNRWVERFLALGESGVETRVSARERMADDRGPGHVDSLGRWRYENAYLPTEEEIAAACLRIQATWSEQDRQRHWVGRDRLDWLPPELVGVDDEGEAVAGWT